MQGSAPAAAAGVSGAARAAAPAGPRKRGGTASRPDAVCRAGWCAQQSHLMKLLSNGTRFVRPLRASAPPLHAHGARGTRAERPSSAGEGPA